MGFWTAGTAGQVIAIALTLGVHILGAIALIYLLVRDSGENARDWWPGGDDEPPRDGPRDPDPRGGGGGLPLPLPVADPSPVRLREHGQIADGYPRRPRRPVHPDRDPARAPAKR